MQKTFGYFLCPNVLTPGTNKMYSPKATTSNPWHKEVAKNMREERLDADKEFVPFASIRLEFMEDGTIQRIINGDKGVAEFPPPSATLERVIAEKIALLKLAPVGKKIHTVGRRHSETVYYIRVFQEDMRVYDHEV